MTQCNNCFSPVGGRSSVSCSACQSPLHKECVISFDGAPLCDLCFVVETEKPKSKFGEFTLPERIRRTYIETYRSCPYKFYLEVIKGNTMPPNIYTELGSDLHELFEVAIQNPSYPKEKMMENIKFMFDRYPDEYFNTGFSTSNKENMWTRAIESIDTFYTILPSLNGVFAVEENIEFNIGDNIPNVSITMDLITEMDGELFMHDWKTGKVMVGKKLSSDLQAPLYIYAVKHKYNKPVKSFTFYYLQENKTRTFVRSETNPDEYICTVGKKHYVINLTDAIREVKSIFSRITKGDFNIPQDTRKMHFTCKMCHLQKQGLCAGADEESWNQL